MHTGGGLAGGGVRRGGRDTAVRLESVEIWIGDVAGPCLVPVAENKEGATESHLPHFPDRTVLERRDTNISEKFPETCHAHKAQAADLNRVNMECEVFLAGLARVGILLVLIFSAH